MFVYLNPPPEVTEQSEREIRLARLKFRSRRVRMGKARRRKVDKNIRNWLKEQDEAVSSQRAKLADLNDFLCGKPESVDFPFGPEFSSNIDVRLAKAYCRMLSSQFKRSVFGDPGRTYVVPPIPGIKRDILNQAELAINWTAENTTNFNEELRDSFYPAYRDGTALLHGHWYVRIERGIDHRLYTDPSEFMKDYPDSETAGITDEEYDETVAYLGHEGTDVHVEYDLDFIAHNAPEYRLFPMAKFIRYPLHEQRLERMSIYGYGYTESAAAFESNAKYGYYDSDVAEEVRKKTPDNTEQGISWDSREDALEGVSHMNSSSVRYRLAWLVYADDLNEDDVIERYIVIYDLDKNRALRIERYTMRRNIPCIVPFRLSRRPGRFAGDSLLEDGEPLFKEINALHRHRSNQRRITDSVTLIMPESLREYVDLGSEYHSFRPGGTWYIPEQFLNKNLIPRQLEVRDTSRTNTSIDEEAFLEKYLDLLEGSSQGQSGRESPTDPNAPASKTAMLLSRADVRVEDIIDEWRRTVPAALQLHCALIYQNMSGGIPVMSRKGSEMVEKLIPLGALSDPRLKGALKPIKPSTSPESEMNRIAAIMMAAMKFLLPVQTKPEILIEGWNDFVAASRIANAERYQIQMGDKGQMELGGAPVNPENLQNAMGDLYSNMAAHKSPQINRERPELAGPGRTS